MNRVPTDSSLAAAACHLTQTLNDLVDLRAGEVESSFVKVADALLDGYRLLICGNGGSAADAQHLAGELVSSFKLGLDRPALDAIALSANSSVVTAYVNDFDPVDVFARQVEAHGRRGDYLLCISTSGQSTNVVAAARAGLRAGLNVLGLSGRDGGLLSEVAQETIVVPSDDTQTIQAVHLVLEHYLCELVEARFESRKGAI